MVGRVEESAASSRSTQVEIELGPGEPLQGSIRSHAGRKAFVGWIELANALEALRGAMAPKAGAEGQAGDPDAGC
jgi:hypothetical protein